MEHWREIPGFKKYEASTFGNIRNKKGQVIKKIINNGYYKIVLIDDNGKRKQARVNRLIAIAWLPNPNKYPQVDHIDENKLNNRIDNLEWVTASMNCKRRYQNNPNCLQPVPLCFENDNETIYFISSATAAIHFEVSTATIWGVSINNRRWRGYNVRRISIEEYANIPIVED